MITSKFADRLRQLEAKHYLVVVIAAIILFGAFFGIYNYRQEQLKPVELQITSPVPGVYEQEKISIEGLTKKNTPVSINEEVVNSDKDGNFSKEINLVVGQNEINVTAGRGKEESRETVVVTRQEPPANIVDPVNSPTADSFVEPGASLNNSGPETLWIPELLLLSGSALFYGLSRKKLKEARE